LATLDEAGFRGRELDLGLDELPERGVYTLVIRVEGELTLNVGSLGEVRLKPGFYLYVGSALGRGPFGLRGRVRRHLSKGKKEFWHIDYLLNHPSTSVEAVVASLCSERQECRVLKALLVGLRAEVPVEGFGASDCRSGCPAHLVFVGRDDPTERVREVYVGLGLTPLVIRAR